MTKKEIIEQLESIKEDSKSHIECSRDMFPNEKPNIFEKDVEAISKVIKLLEELEKECNKNLFVKSTLKCNETIKEWLEDGKN